MTLSTSRIALSLAGLAAVVLVAAAPQLLGPRVSDAFGALDGADPVWLGIAGTVFALAFLASVAAWRAALGAAGGEICPLQAGARLGVGSLVNAVAPAKLGDAVKIALCSKAIRGPQRVWTAGGVYAALGAARCLTLAVLVVAASATGALPLWPVFVLCGGVAALAAVALTSERFRRHRRIAHLLGGIAALERSPRAAAAALGWTAGAAFARLVATAAVAAALGLPHPFLAALVIMPAMELAGAIPLTPGNVGVGSGAAALALQSRGIGVTQALGVGITIQALETLVSVVAGGAGGVYLAWPSPVVRRWTVRVAAVGVSAGLAVVGVIALDLV